jgi:hypothetical protein
MAVTCINLLAEILRIFPQIFDAQMQLVSFDSSKKKTYKIDGQNCLHH